MGETIKNLLVIASVVSWIAWAWFGATIFIGWLSPCNAGWPAFCLAPFLGALAVVVITAIAFGAMAVREWASSVSGSLFANDRTAEERNSDG